MERIAKSIAAIGGLLLALCTTKTIVFYLIFGIDIVQYISASEVVMSSLDFSIFIPLVGVFGYFTGVSVPASTFVGPKHNDNPYLEISAMKRVSKIMYILFSTLALLVFVYSFWAKTVSERFVSWTLASVLILIIPGSEYMRMKTVDDNRRPSTSVRSVLVALTLYTILSIGWSVARGLYLKYDPQNYQYVFVERNDKKVPVSDSLIFVGRTEKFTFIYNRITEASEALSNEEILSLMKIKISRK